MAADFDGNLGGAVPLGVVLEPMLRGSVCDLFNTPRLAGRLFTAMTFLPDAVNIGQKRNCCYFQCKLHNIHIQKKIHAKKQQDKNQFFVE